MARYIKANPKVAEFLHLENDRNRVTDGNYLLWQADILAFGKLIDLPEILEQIGGIALLAHEAREEQDGTVVRPLPTATDPRFIIETAAATNEADSEDETDGETNNTSEETNGATEETNSPVEETNEAEPETNGQSEETNQQSEETSDSEDEGDGDTNEESNEA